MASTIPAGFADLLERPLFAHLATVHPDGSPQSSVMWFVWEGDVIRFTHTSRRQKYRNVAHEPRVALSIVDPDDTGRYLEIRGQVISVEPDDAEASFYRSLQERYGDVYPITDADVRVVITVLPEYARGRGEGDTSSVVS
ncbi:pyridoxamine 5'-phosphate oxidase-related protein FMN-binding [Beutenbergia cavernae DSM 12333]|uniref:Pyridoxamine 5'-phosphate oxidase-related protein FMN-binding n=1 Tax=Beutenbergia cavernae (strain ATCC BAA-8 / DSM 12333 / CCUG 43141 / JCM 11478 / NBRC 16432 / NCIMB 13614 / HKI 0122) TaxID=471853 RepID=C5C0B5_BEUC1|nr:PPOX class F420-dependent oxidoreductase [Beutenbergia cavernae]ACQ79301.1 pyridoxamine 5'-phosphate oxidase-related protein FMN-binding [Beutenbergia cavernae DSM 12333]